MSVKRFVSVGGAVGLALIIWLPTASTPAGAKTAREIRQCKALNKCRLAFTRCWYRIERDPKKTWATHEWECAGPYGKCIDKHFGTFDMFFTRMFDPRVQDCRK